MTQKQENNQTDDHENNQTDDIVDESDEIEGTDPRLYMSNMYNLLRSINDYPDLFLAKDYPLNPYK